MVACYDLGAIRMKHAVTSIRARKESRGRSCSYTAGIPPLSVRWRYLPHKFRCSALGEVYVAGTTLKSEGGKITHSAKGRGR